jgi:hypothetical protein
VRAILPVVGGTVGTGVSTLGAADAPRIGAWVTRATVDGAVEGADEIGTLVGNAVVGLVEGALEGVPTACVVGAWDGATATLKAIKFPATSVKNKEDPSEVWAKSERTGAKLS